MTSRPPDEAACPESLEATLGWRFRDRDLLARALTHSTYANENPDEGPDYERLEFLGDAVLDLVCAHILYEQLDEASEGELSRRRARVVRRETLARLATHLDLERYVRLGQGQRRNQKGTSQRILADSFEAVAGAVYLDGGYTAVKTCFSPYIAAGIAQTSEPLDFKTRLQEACHRLGKPPPVYGVVATQGPDHARLFTCEVRVADAVLGRGEGSSKKIAEQMCARLAFQSLQEEES